MSRNLHLDLDPDHPDYEEQKAAVEALGPYRYVSVKSYHVEDIADAAEELGIDPVRFRELMRVPEIDDYATAPEEKKRMLREPREFCLSRDDVAELCAFVNEVVDDMDEAIDLEATIERWRQVPSGENLEDHFDEFELKCLDAWSSLGVMVKMCDVAEEHGLGMEVV